MDPEQIATVLLTKTKELEWENSQLRSMLGLNTEKRELKARSFRDETHEEKARSFRDETHEELPVCSTSGRTFCSLGENTCDERNFRKDLQLSSVKTKQRTSSPIDFKSFLLSSMNTDTSEKADSQSHQVDLSLNVKGEKRLLGEIAFQLDRRILSYVFQGHRRHYGFTLINIPDKIREVSTHSLTGKVDEGYRLYLTQRYVDLMERLGRLGYKTALHPFFTEFVVNTFGILKIRPDEYSTCNNADFLKKTIIAVAPEKLQKDLLLVHTCLCYMAQTDGNILLLW